jgi:hypothetical protein
MTQIMNSQVLNPGTFARSLKRFPEVPQLFLLALEPHIPPIRGENEPVFAEAGKAPDGLYCFIG